MAVEKVAFDTDVSLVRAQAALDKAIDDMQKAFTKISKSTIKRRLKKWVMVISK